MGAMNGRTLFLLFLILAGILLAAAACDSGLVVTSLPLSSVEPSEIAAVSPSPASAAGLGGTPTPAIIGKTQPHTPVQPADSPLVTPSPTSSPTLTRRPPAPGEAGYDLWFPIIGNQPATPTPTPTPTPTETPTPLLPPTPVWPEPLAAPGPSKLGLHVIRNNSPWIMEFIRRVRPAVVKAVGDVGWLNEVKQASPETVTIGRLIATHQDMNGDPAVAAQAFVAEQLTRYQLNLGVDYWEGWNEPDPNENMAWYAAFEAERVRLLAEHGFRAAIGSFATGVPEFDEFAAFLPAVQAARQYGGILSLHEYGAPTFDYLVGTPLPGWPPHPDRGVLALRYRWWYEELLKPRNLVIPLAITEAGIDGMLMSGQRPGPAGMGWTEFSDYWTQTGIGGWSDGYIRQLSWYDGEVRRDDYVIGFAVFTAGAVEGWTTYEINSILPELALYVAEAR
jgi:hypothetical protein